MVEVWVPKQQQSDVARYVLSETTVRVVHTDGTEYVCVVTPTTARVLRRIAVRQMGVAS